MNASTPLNVSSGSPAATLFDGYSCEGVYDEMFSAPGVPRPHYAALYQQLASMSLEQFRAQQQNAETAFLRQGITFNVFSDDQGVERPIPVDLVPRILPHATWTKLEAGLKQRIAALNLFVHDIYHQQRILRQGILPLDLVLGSSGYRPEFRGASVPRDIYIHVAGIDLIRDTDGAFMVLEDNLRCPSGVSYLLENRRVMKRVFPRLFEHYHVLPVEEYSLRLREMLEYIAPPRAGDPVVVVLTPGPYNSAYFEHTFLAQQMGVQLVQGQDLVIESGMVYMRTTRGPQRVDVLYRRIDDEYLDSVAFQSGSLLGVAGLVGAYRLGHVGLANGIGVGVADNKAVYHFVPQIIRYYLGEEPLLGNVPTYLAAQAGDRAYILEHLHELVVKAVDQSGGYGMLIGPHATRAERADFAARIRANPDGYIAQPTITLSRHPTLAGDQFAGRHIDLRPFIIYGKEISVLPGGFTRVALRPGSLVVNSSQGGGSKDTWVLEGGAVAVMLSRVAENIFWMGRYVERAENTARIIDVNFRLLLDTGAAPDQAAAWSPLVNLVPQTQALFAERYPCITPDAVCQFMTFDSENPNSILSAITYARENARSSRESISSEMWELLNTLYLSITGAGAQTAWAKSPPVFYRQTQYGSQQFQGTTDATMVHDEGWHFIQVGKFLERADNATRILDAKHRLLTPDAGEAVADHTQLVALLKSCSAYEAYRRRQQLARIDPRGVAQFLLLDALFPRSVLFSVDETWTALKAIGGSGTPKYSNAAERTLGLLRAQLEFADIDDVLADLHGYLDTLQRYLNRVGEEMQRVYLHAQLRPAFSTAESRAAQAMAAQQ